MERWIDGKMDDFSAFISSASWRMREIFLVFLGVFVLWWHEWKDGWNRGGDADLHGLIKRGV
jgi:hypothetical protein